VVWVVFHLQDLHIMLHLPLCFLMPPEVVTALTASALLFHFLHELVLSPSLCPCPEPRPFPWPSWPSQPPRPPRPPCPPPDLENLDFSVNPRLINGFRAPWDAMVRITTIETCINAVSLRTIPFLRYIQRIEHIICLLAQLLDTTQTR
jgi:hypothetical protein